MGLRLDVIARARTAGTAASAPSPPTLSGERVGVRGWRFVQRGGYALENIVGAKQNVVVPESEYPQPEHFDCGSSSIIVGSLIEMLAAIEFDREPAFETGEVEDVARQAMLAAEFRAKLPVAQSHPQLSLSVSLCTAKLFRVISHAPSPCPLPQAMKPLGGEGFQHVRVGRGIRLHVL